MVTRLSPQRESFKLEATAEDKGYPPLKRSVEVQIDVVDRANNPPVWDHSVYGPIYITENMPVGAKVVSVKARSVVCRMQHATPPTQACFPAFSAVLNHSYPSYSSYLLGTPEAFCMRSVQIQQLSYFFK